MNHCMNKFQNELEQQHKRIKQAGLDSLFIQSEDIYSIIKQLIDKHDDSANNDRHLKVAQVGASFLEKPIYKMTVGTGPVSIFLWSQMHGDEPTATASLFDLINYIGSPENKAWFDSWREKLTLHIVPMINPDGADLVQRVNAQGIDINRDAKALQSPEGRLLLSIAEETNPQFGFNLHSQSRYYTVGQSKNSAVISLLAPAYNDAKETNQSRKAAKQLVSVINRSIHQQYPNHVGRYDDTYSSRSFGDLFSAKGISTILIEAGYYDNDKHRQVPRWLTFLSLVESINTIRDQSHVDVPLQSYSAIPFNNADGLVDLLLKNVSINDNYQVDIAINYDKFFENGRIDSIGDLSTITGLSSRDMQHYQVQAMKGFQLNEAMTLSTSRYRDLLRQGYGYFLGDASLLNRQTSFPVVIHSEPIDSEQFNNRTRLNLPANFLFYKDTKISLAIIQGVVIELDTSI